MKKYFSADFVLPVSGPPLPDAVVETDAQGVILKIWKDRADIPDQENIQHHQGIIVPGFVNAHCHLELSHMLGKIPQKTGLVEFVKAVISKRVADDTQVMDAMRQADRKMSENGIVAVGDHANRTISHPVKRDSPIYYHTFVELIGLEPDQARQLMEQAMETAAAYEGLAVSVTPHAPYSVSKSLFMLAKETSQDQDPGKHPVSIHNQESEEENRLFRYKKGDFVGFYQWMGKDINQFKVTNRSSLQSIAAALPSNQGVQLVHNTFTRHRDTHLLHRMGKKVYWCLCPGANLYIENQLPNIQTLLHTRYPITIGTDSLASNDGLCVLSELKRIHSHLPELDLQETICWATWNGAAFLGITGRYGSIEPGKQPGLNLLENTDGLSIGPGTTVRKLI